MSSSRVLLLLYISHFFSLILLLLLLCWGTLCGYIANLVPTISSQWYSWMNRKRNCDSLISYSIISNSPFVERMDSDGSYFLPFSSFFGHRKTWEFGLWTLISEYSAKRIEKINHQSLSTHTHTLCFLHSIEGVDEWSHYLHRKTHLNINILNYSQIIGDCRLGSVAAFFVSVPPTPTMPHEDFGDNLFISCSFRLSHVVDHYPTW